MVSAPLPLPGAGAGSAFDLLGDALMMSGGSGGGGGGSDLLLMMCEPTPLIDLLSADMSGFDLHSASAAAGSGGTCFAHHHQW